MYFTFFPNPFRWKKNRKWKKIGRIFQRIPMFYWCNNSITSIKTVMGCSTSYRTRWRRKVIAKLINYNVRCESKYSFAVGVSLEFSILIKIKWLQWWCIWFVDKCNNYSTCLACDFAFNDIVIVAEIALYDIFSFR